jgi:pimeloyl-ACP methyl ester carboxylesterase
MKLHHTERGGGMNLVLVHGFPLDGRIWDEALDRLGKQRRVIVVDLPGFGKSQSADAFTMESMADALHSHLKEIGALPCVLGGLSMGGYAALAYAEKYPMDLKGLLLIDTRAEGDSTEGKAGRAKMIDLVREKGSKAVAEQMMGKMICDETRNKKSAVANRLREIMESCPPKTIENALAAMRDRKDRTEMLASIAVPTLVIVGDQDAITPIACAELMQENIPQAEMVVVPSSGHMSPMENPNAVSDAIEGFMEKVK